MWLPINVGNLKPSTPLVTFEGHCYKNIHMELGTDQVISVKYRNPKSIFCLEYFLIANTDIASFHIQDTQINLKIPDIQGARTAFKTNGVEVYLFCLDLPDLLGSIFQQAKTLLGGMGVNGASALFQPAVPQYMEDANVKFYKDYMGWDMVERPQWS